MAFACQAQMSDPMGLYQLKEIYQQNGKVVIPQFVQYKYCADSITLQIMRNSSSEKESYFYMQNVNKIPLRYTGELSKTENKGLQIFDKTDSAFTLRWYNNYLTNNRYFPYQTNIDEKYVVVSNPNNPILCAMNMLKTNFDGKSKTIEGVWKLRGKQYMACATSEYWAIAPSAATYKIFGGDMLLDISLNGDFPQKSAFCHIIPYTSLSSNVISENGQPAIVTVIDAETLTLTQINHRGTPEVTIWDRCGLPLQAQTIWGTHVPLMKKNLSRYRLDSVQKMYGKLSDAKMRDYETYDFLVNCNERNNAIFPILMECGFRAEYEQMRDSLMSRLMHDSINVEQAVSNYVFWFSKNFDEHTNINAPTFQKMRQTSHVDYSKCMRVYAPKPVACAVDESTFLIRIPSSDGQNPTLEWVNDQVKKFKVSGYKYLILDVRGNGGGTDEICAPVEELMGDCGGKKDERHFYRSSYENNKALKCLYEDDANWYEDLGNECENIEDGSFAIWRDFPKGTFIFTPVVKKGAVIMDNNSASAAESPLRFIRNYSKTHAKIFGRDISFGCDNTGNVNSVKLPNSVFTFNYPLTVSKDFYKTCKLRQKGIAPDVKIPLPYPETLTDNIDSWVLWVAKYLKNKNSAFPI